MVEFFNMRLHTLWLFSATQRLIWTGHTCTQNYQIYIIMHLHVYSILGWKLSQSMYVSNVTYCHIINNGILEKSHSIVPEHPFALWHHDKKIIHCVGYKMWISTNLCIYQIICSDIFFAFFTSQQTSIWSSHCHLHHYNNSWKLRF